MKKIETLKTLKDYNLTCICPVCKSKLYIIDANNKKVKEILIKVAK